MMLNHSLFAMLGQSPAFALLERLSGGERVMHQQQKGVSHGDQCSFRSVLGFAGHTPELCVCRRILTIELAQIIGQVSPSINLRSIDNL